MFPMAFNCNWTDNHFQLVRINCSKSTPFSFSRVRNEQKFIHMLYVSNLHNTQGLCKFPTCYFDLLSLDELYCAGLTKTIKFSNEKCIKNLYLWATGGIRAREAGKRLTSDFISESNSSNWLSTLCRTALAGLLPAKLSLDKCWCDSAKHST